MSFSRTVGLSSALSMREPGADSLVCFERQTRTLRICT